MATRKSTSRKKTARRKATRRTPARSKTGRRKAAARKKTTRRKAPTRNRSVLTVIEAELLPPTLKAYSRRARRGLSRLERQVTTARRDALRRWAHLIREVSLQLGRLEARGEREWRKQSLKARRDAARLLRRLEKAVAPPQPRKKAASRKTRRARR